MHKSHFKKWCKKGNFMLVNGYIAWNMLAKMKGIFRETIDNSNWRVFVAELMINWTVPIIDDDIVVCQKVSVSASDVHGVKEKIRAK